MNNQIEFSKPGEWVMRITADRRIEVNENVTVTEAAQTVLEAVQKLLNQPERKPLTDQEIEATFLTCNGRWDGDRWVIEDADFHPFVRAITALRAALERLEQEPLALIRDGVLCWHIPNEHYSRPAWTAHGTHMLYTTPPPRKPLTEIELDAEFNRGYKEGARDAYARAPQRKPLTDDEIAELYMSNTDRPMKAYWEFARAIEQAHGIGEKT